MSNRRRRRSAGILDAEVPLSPLIDCVFLMLIFFLVTSMIKRWERQIPTRMQQDASVVERGEENQEVELGVDTQGRIYAISGRSKAGLKSNAVGNVREFMAQKGADIPRDQPIILIAEENTDFQTFVQVLDEFEIQGFTRLRVRSSDVRLQGGGNIRKAVKP